MCTQAVYLVKQTYCIITTWEEILKLLLPVQCGFHSLTWCFLKIGEIPCNPLTAAVRSSKRDDLQLQPGAALQPHGWNTARCGERALFTGHGGLTDAEREAGTCRRRVGTARSIQRLEGEAVFLYRREKKTRMEACSPCKHLPKRGADTVIRAVLPLVRAGAVIVCTLPFTSRFIIPLQHGWKVVQTQSGLVSQSSQSLLLI